MTRHQAGAARRQLPEMLKGSGSWKALGCETPPAGTASWLGAEAVRVCYARGVGTSGRAVATVYYTGDWKVGYFDVANY